MSRREPRYRIGQIVHHVIADYRGVVVGVDREFQGTDEWYLCHALTLPPKGQSFYHVLPNGADHAVYVPERDLEADEYETPIQHPLLPFFFDRFVDGEYQRILN